jgi:hypothetical protein
MNRVSVMTCATTSTTVASITKMSAVVQDMKHVKGGVESVRTIAL